MRRGLILVGLAVLALLAGAVLLLTNRAPTSQAPPVMTSTAAPAPPPPAVVDELPDVANIAFNAPDTMNERERSVLQLLLDVRRTAADLQRDLREPGAREGATIRIAPVIEARLSGAAFDIRPITPEEQIVSATDTTEWQWEITPRQPGRHRLFLTVNAVYGSGAEQRRRSIRTFDRTIEVVVAQAPLARWAIPAALSLLFFLALFLVVRSRRRDPERTAVMIAPSPAFRVGDTIAGRYRITRFLGKGGMGAVYAAEDLEFPGETVALKTIIATDEHAMPRFKREIQLARRVAHHNVCKVFDVGYHEAAEARVIFVSMEYVEGKPLSHLIREKGRISEREALPIIRDVAAGLAAIHSAGIVHRDVKSGNIMIADEDGRAVVMDFGLACLTGDETTFPSLTRTGAIVGSPMYMAPEQLEGGLLSAATDIYAFAIVIYEMVTGRLPFEGDTPMSIIARRLKEPPIPPRRFLPHLDAEWERTILVCLERDPARRFQNAVDVARSLESQPDVTTQIM